MAQLISVNPDPMQAGQKAEICFDFSDGATSPVVATLTFVTGGDNVQVELEFENTDGKRCVKVDVPANGLTYQIVDETGQSDDCSGLVDP